MELDSRTTLIVQISAAVATNALAALRASVTDAKALGISAEEIRLIVKTAQEIQDQPVSHARHLLDQLLREPVRKPQEHTHDHVHGPGCSCGHHHQ